MVFRERRGYILVKNSIRKNLIFSLSGQKAISRKGTLQKGTSQNWSDKKGPIQKRDFTKWELYKKRML